MVEVMGLSLRVTAVAMLQLLLLARSVSAQQSDACLTNAQTMLEADCFSYMYGIADGPDSTCCSQLDFLTSEYGSSCLCGYLVAYEQAYPTDSITAGRIYNLASGCNRNVVMSNCSEPTSQTTPVSQPAPTLPTPPTLQNPPTSQFPQHFKPPTLESPPFDPSTTPSFDVPAAGRQPPAPRNRVSKRAAVGGSLGGLAVVAIVVSVLVKCFCCTSSDSNSKSAADGTSAV